MKKILLCLLLCVYIPTPSILAKERDEKQLESTVSQIIIALEQFAQITDSNTVIKIQATSTQGNQITQKKSVLEKNSTIFRLSVALNRFSQITDSVIKDRTTTIDKQFTQETNKHEQVSTTNIQPTIHSNNLVQKTDISHAEAGQSIPNIEKYARNSLATMIIIHPEDEFSPYILSEFENIPLSDKYDDHNFGWRRINNDDFSGVQKKKDGLYKARYGKTLTAHEIRKNAMAIEKRLNEAQCGRDLVAKWFNMKRVSGSNIPVFDTELIQYRGQYNATDLDVDFANLTARGISILSDAGEELIDNTYILVNDITYVTAEQRAAVAKVVLAVLGGILDGITGDTSGRELAETAGQIADSFTGFTVMTHSYLYKLEWNEEVANIFYNNYYSATPDPQKYYAFINDANTFKVKFVAHEYEFAGKTKLKAKYDRRELVKTVCARSLDKNIAALQLKYEDFKVKAPIYEVITNERGHAIEYTAKVGKKEGITSRTRFTVVEKQIDPETHKTYYRRVAKLKPINGKIWDNRYNAVLEGDRGAHLESTTFKKISGGKILPGMLIIEGKYKSTKKRHI